MLPFPLHAKDLEAAIRPTTSLVSVMTVNNEIGVLQPVRDIGERHTGHLLRLPLANDPHHLHVP